MEITPVRSADGLVYHLSYAIKIKPYPNPFSYGGMCGGGAVKTQEELDQAIAKFNDQADALRSNGMEKVEIVTHEETVKVEQKRRTPEILGKRTVETLRQTKRKQEPETPCSTVQQDTETKQLVLI